MKRKWKERIKKLDWYLKVLDNCKPTNRKNLSGTPKSGVYMFLERNKPIYIGRTNRMRNRLLEHGRLGSKHNDASFAFLIAKKKIKNQKHLIDLSRPQLCASESFRPYFLQAKNRVSQMSIKYVEINDPIDQALFEVYAAEIFQTPYNDFDNH